MNPRAFDCDVERYLSTMEVAGQRFHRALVPPGEYVGGWERGARVTLPDNRPIVFFRWVLVDWGVAGVRIDAGAEIGSAKCRAILRSLGIGSCEELPVSRDECYLIQVLELEPLPEPLGSVVRSVRPATPDDVCDRTDEILLELEREGL